MSTVEPPVSPADWSWLDRNIAKVDQLEIPGADVDPHRALDLLARHNAIEHEREMNDLEIDRGRHALQIAKRVEKQEAVIGWIRVSAIALLVPALQLIKLKRELDTTADTGS